MAKIKQPTSSLYPLKMTGFAGINNVTPAEKCKPGELQTASNVDIVDSGQVVDRQGFDKIYTSAGDLHSLYSNGVNGNATFTVFRETTTLKKLNSDNTATNLRTGMTHTGWMKYLALNNLLYYTDNSITGITNGTTDRSWGLAVPANTFVLSQTTGLMPLGWYLVTITYVRTDGQESGAPASKEIYLTSNNAGITVSNISASPDSDYLKTNVYISTRNGELLYLATSISAGDFVTYAGDTKEFKLPLATLLKGPPHPGHLIAYYNGRIYIARDEAVWYTEAFNYELMDLAHGFILFQGKPTLIAPVIGGMFVSVKNYGTFFLSGKGPEDFSMIKKTDHWAFQGSGISDQIVLRDGQISMGWYWTSDDGIYLGLDGGILLNKTDNRYEPGSADIGIPFIKKTSDGSKQYICVLYEE